MALWKRPCLLPGPYIIGLYSSGSKTLVMMASKWPTFEGIPHHEYISRPQGKKKGYNGQHSPVARAAGAFAPVPGLLVSTVSPGYSSRH